MNRNQVVKELTLMLLYLTSWTEKKPYDYQRSWKGYDFDVLNELAEDGDISDSKRSKSVVIYEDGIDKAKDLLSKYELDSLLES
jgi:hypothetical protein